MRTFTPQRRFFAAPSLLVGVLACGGPHPESEPVVRQQSGLAVECTTVAGACSDEFELCAGTCGSTSGGTAGFDDAVLCPTGHVMTGIHGRAGSRIDRLMLECSPIDLGEQSMNGERMVRQIVPAAPDAKFNFMGGNGGDPFYGACPTGQVVSTILGRTGSKVDAITFDCTDLQVTAPFTPGAPWALSSAGATYSHPVTYGGGGGSRTYVYSCPSGKVPVGLHGSANSEVIAVGLICQTVHYDPETAVCSQRKDCNENEALYTSCRCDGEGCRVEVSYRACERFSATLCNGTTTQTMDCNGVGRAISNVTTGANGCTDAQQSSAHARFQSTNSCVPGP